MGLAGGGAHIGILLVQVLVALVQDVVGIPDLFPHAHGLGRRGGVCAWACAYLSPPNLALPAPCRSGAKGRSLSLPAPEV